MSHNQRGGDAYLKSSSMVATSNSMALVSSVLHFDIVEIWSTESDNKLKCRYVHASEELFRLYPEIIVGHYPNHKKEHKLSPAMCEKAKKSKERFHWRTVDAAPPGSNCKSLLHADLHYPGRTEMAYMLKGGEDLGSFDVYIVGFALDVIAYRPAKLKFLDGIGYAIFVAAFYLDDEENNGEMLHGKALQDKVASDSAMDEELDQKEFNPNRHKTVVDKTDTNIGEDTAANGGSCSNNTTGASTHHTLNDTWKSFNSVENLLALNGVVKPSIPHNFNSFGTDSTSAMIKFDSDTGTERRYSNADAIGLVIDDGTCTPNADRSKQGSSFKSSAYYTNAEKNSVSSRSRSQSQVSKDDKNGPLVESVLLKDNKFKQRKMNVVETMQEYDDNTNGDVENGYDELLVETKRHYSNASGNSNDNNSVVNASLSTANSMAYSASALPFVFSMRLIPVVNVVPNNLILNRDFKNVEYICDGSNSNIYRAMYNNQLVIVKMIKSEAQRDQVAITEFDAEQGLLCRINHPNILKLLGGGDKPRRFLVLERLDGGSLSTILAKNQANESSFTGRFFRRPTFTYATLLAKCRDIADALDYLHNNCCRGATIIHRDIKPDNIGFTVNGILKLFDFGLCTCVKQRTSSVEAYQLTGNTGSLRYMAPEVALRKAYTEKVDVYSFGILAWQMAKDRVPFKGMNRNDFIKRVVTAGERPKIDKTWPKGFSNLLTACWHVDPTQRPSFRAIIKDLNAIIEEHNGINGISGGLRSIGSSSPSNTVINRRPSGGSVNGTPGTTPTGSNLLHALLGGSSISGSGAITQQQLQQHQQQNGSMFYRTPSSSTIASGENTKLVRNNSNNSVNALGFTNQPPQYNQNQARPTVVTPQSSQTMVQKQQSQNVNQIQSPSPVSHYQNSSSSSSSCNSAGAPLSPANSAFGSVSSIQQQLQHSLNNSTLSALGNNIRSLF